MTYGARYHPAKSQFQHYKDKNQQCNIGTAYPSNRAHCPPFVVLYHDDVIKWTHFPRNWPFVRGIHRSRWIPHTKASDAELWCFPWSTPNKRLSKQWPGWWFETLCFLLHIDWIYPFDSELLWMHLSKYFHLIPFLYIYMAQHIG